jgi:hypothetical protein
MQQARNLKACKALAPSGDDLVLAVGQAAENGLYSNPCGWTNPAGDAAGGTPFYIP